MNAFQQLKQNIQTESSRAYKARGVKLIRCDACKLSPEFCICDAHPNANINIDFILVFHKDEIYKPTNTGRLIADAFPNNTFAFCHNRLEPPQELLDIINDESREFYIVFPATEMQKRATFSEITKPKGKKLTFILLDGTWRQGRRMFNHSKWLAHLPALILNPEDKSRYATRKAAYDNYLSTAESAALALAAAQAESAAKILFDYFDLFNQRYVKMKPKRT